MPRPVGRAAEPESPKPEIRLRTTFFPGPVLQTITTARREEPGVNSYVPSRSRRTPSRSSSEFEFRTGIDTDSTVTVIMIVISVRVYLPPSAALGRAPPPAAARAAWLRLLGPYAGLSVLWDNSNGCSASRRGLRVTIGVTIDSGLVAMIGTSRLGDTTAGISDPCR